jgi:hypothetical protein
MVLEYVEDFFCVNRKYCDFTINSCEKKVDHCVDNGEECGLYSITMKVKITSLNLNFAPLDTWHKMLGLDVRSALEALTDILQFFNER